MAITNDTKMPTDEELTVPQEITLSTPWLKAVAVYMGRDCENEMKEFMLLRSESEDPRTTLKEGAAVTACGVNFLRKLKKTCLDEVTNYADCIDKSHHRLYISVCREPQRFLDRCVEEKLKIPRPPLGYFSKIHVHESKLAKQEYKLPDYKAEAAKMIDELPKEFHMRKDYKRFHDRAIDVFDR